MRFCTADNSWHEYGSVPAIAAEKTPEKAKEETDYRFEGDTFEVAFHVDGKWNHGYNANTTVTNTGEETI